MPNPHPSTLLTASKLARLAGVSLRKIQEIAAETEHTARPLGWRIGDPPGVWVFAPDAVDRVPKRRRVKPDTRTAEAPARAARRSPLDRKPA
jgi:hypothetical protein